MIIIGHRGARGLAPENTIAGFKKALEYKVDEIEFDVRVTKDGIPVLMHNPYLTDAAGNRLRLSHFTYAALKMHKPDIATFEEAICFAGPKVRLYIEVKPNEPTAPIVAVIKKALATDIKASNLILASKSQRSLLALHQALPELETIVIEKWSGVRARYRARQLGTKRLSMRSWWLWSGFIQAMDRQGYQLVAYTMNNPAKARRWAQYGLRGVVTDYPDRFEKRIKK